MGDVFSNGFYRGVELSFMVWVLFLGTAWIVNVARDYFGAP